MEKLSFNKRIARTKMEVAPLIQAEDLDKAGNTRSGYYSIKTIMSNLNAVMDKYDIDIDLNIAGKIIYCTWIDCESEATRVVTIELKPIDEIERLASMQNIIQSQGAVMSYYRRYALTNVLNLNATDLIENSTNVNNKPQNKPQPATQPTQNTPKPQPAQSAPQAKIVNEAQLKRLFAIMNSKGKTEADINAYIKAKKWPIQSKKQLTIDMYDLLINALEKYPNVNKK